MPRFKESEKPRPSQRSGGSLMAGMLIGTAIMAMATQAMVFGAGAALGGVPVKPVD